MSSTWIPLTRDYASEAAALSVSRENVQFHPLASKFSVAAEKSAPSSPSPLSPASSPSASTSAASPASFVDPLRGPAVIDPLRSPSSSSFSAPTDPLRAMMSSSSKYESKIAPSSSFSSSSSPLRPLVPSPSSEWSYFEPWKDKRAKVLSKYSTTKTMPVSANFLDDDVKESQANKEVSSTRSRLEKLELEEGTSDESKLYMSQKEYIAHIEEQHERLKNAWEGGERVLALKIAIQCAKLLGDTSVPHFYPSMYVLLTGILETFGELVFQRIKSRGMVVIKDGVQKTVPLPDDFRASDVSTSAKETCRNWFYKTACIRELMPRFYIDLALSKSYRFLDDTDFGLHLQRLGKTIRGIGDPLAATYARAFLVTKANDSAASFSSTPPPPGVLPASHNHALLEAFDDFMFTFKHLKSSHFVDVTAVQKAKIALDEYIDLYSPAVQWMLQNIGYRGSEELFFALIQQYRDYCNNSIVLLHLLSSFRPQLVSKHALDMVQLIKASDTNSQLPKSRLYLALGKAMMSCPPPEAQRLAILNDVWKAVTKIEDPTEYMEIAEVFIQYILVNFTDRETNIFLKDVIKHVKVDQSHLRLQERLLSVLSKTVQFSKDMEKTLSMDHFLPVIDLLEKSAKVEASKSILSRFVSNGRPTADPLILHTLMDVARSLHDSVDSMSLDEDRRQISNLIINLIRKIDFGRDLEQQLNSYVDCRAAFTNLDAVTQELVMRVCLLASRAHQFMKGKHSKKTSSFVKACLAYCHITIPSLDDIFTRLRLLLECGKVALMNQMSVQAEAFLRAAISLLSLVPPTIESQGKKVSSEDELVSFLQHFSSALLLFPGHPEHGPFYLVRGFLNSLENFEPWKQQDNVLPSQGKIRVYMSVLALFCTYAQPTFPYHIDRVESNDSLYGGDSSYMAQVTLFIDTLMEQLVAMLTQLSAATDLIARKRQGTLCLDFVNQIISSLTMNNASATLVVKLFQLAHQTQAVEPGYLRRTLLHIQHKKGSWYQDVAAKILDLGGVSMLLERPAAVPKAPVSVSVTPTASSGSSSVSTSTSSAVVSPLSPAPKPAVAATASVTPKASAVLSSASPSPSSSSPSSSSSSSAMVDPLMGRAF